MASVYPGALDTFSTKQDGVAHVIYAAHVNDLQNSVVAIETQLGTDPAGSATDLKTRLAQSIQDSGPLFLAAMATLPAHYERDQRWVKKTGDNDVLQTPNRITVNVGNNGYALLTQVDLDLSQAATWDTQAPTDYTVAANRAGNNFYVYACQPASGTVPVLLVSANSTVPSGYTADTSRKLAGFHGLCLAVGAIGGHSLTGYLAGDILPDSVWDLHFRPVCSPEGMVYSSDVNKWVDIYLPSGTGVSTASVYGATISDTRNWMDFVDDGHAVDKQLLSDEEFHAIAAGSNQETNITGSADPVTTGGHVDTAARRMISNIGCEDCCGALWQWLRDQSYRFDAATSHTHTENTAPAYVQNATTAGPSGDVAPAWAYYDLPGSKGSLYRQGTYGDAKLLAGGYWSNGSYCGSRARGAHYSRWNAVAYIGARFRAEPRRAEP